MRGARGEPRGRRRQRRAAQVGSGGASSSRLRRAGSHRRYRAGIKPSSAKHLGSSELAPSYGKMCLEALQPSLLQRVTDNPAASPVPRDRPSPSPLGKDIPDPVPFPVQPFSAFHFSKEIPAQPEDFTTLFSEYHNIFFFN